MLVVGINMSVIACRPTTTACFNLWAVEGVCRGERAMAPLLVFRDAFRGVRVLSVQVQPSAGKEALILATTAKMLTMLLLPRCW